MLTIVIVCIGLLVILNSVAGWIYTYIQKPFPSPFPTKPTVRQHRTSARTTSARSA